MEIAKVTVALKGGREHEVTKEQVTPAEVLLLRRIHSPDAVKGIQRQRIEGKDPVRSSSEELERLRRIYKEKHIAAAFPGDLPDLNRKFSDIKLEFAQSGYENIKLDKPEDAEVPEEAEPALA